MPEYMRGCFPAVETSTPNSWTRDAWKLCYQVVGNRQLAASIRAEALRFLIHFVGDVHQPLHAADNDDRGSNRVRVVLRRRHETVHVLWDKDVVQALGRSP